MDLDQYCRVFSEDYGYACDDTIDQGMAAACKDASPDHERWMNEAVDLARAMQGRVWPNPAVGCVIVGEGSIVGRGQTAFGGRPHAERLALENAGERARGAALYVTLEPCCHWGKTPPCADAIIVAGVKEVFASVKDPDPRVNGCGFRKLREAGVKVSIGLGAVEARQIMAGFFHRIAFGKPLVTFGRRPPRAGVVPDGFDACLHGDRGGLMMISRLSDHETSEEILPYCGDIDELLVSLGKRGLTSIYIANDLSLIRSGSALSP